MASKYPESIKHQVGGRTITGTKVDVSGGLPTNEFVTFGYQAEYSGVAGKGMAMPNNIYDASPVALMLGPAPGGFYALNSNYLNVSFNKGLFVGSWKIGLTPTAQMFERMIHRYKFSNVLTPLYRLDAMTVDRTVLASAGKWTQLVSSKYPRKTGQPGAI